MIDNRFAEDLHLEIRVLEIVNNDGIELDCFDSLLDIPRPLSVEAGTQLLNLLDQFKHEIMAEMVVRSLCNIKEPIDGTELKNLWERTTDNSLRWAIGNTLSCTKPTGITDWVVATLRNSEYGCARQMLCDAVPKLISKEEAIKVLREVFDDLPMHAATPLGRLGGIDEIAFLEGKLEKHPGYPQKYILKAINHIKYRKKLK